MPKGQYEAGQVLGMTKPQIFFKVVLMQVVKKITAPIGNEIITLVKDTSLSSVIAIPEILMMAKDFSMQGLIWAVVLLGGILPCVLRCFNNSFLVYREKAWIITKVKEGQLCHC